MLLIICIFCTADAEEWHHVLLTSYFMTALSDLFVLFAANLLILLKEQILKQCLWRLIEIL